MGKSLKNTVSVTSAEILASILPRTALDASDKQVIRTALDASNLRANDHSFAADWQDYSLESALDVGPTPAAPANVETDPLAPYADKHVKLVYLLSGNAQLPIGTLYLGSVARDKANEFANNPKLKGAAKVGVYCATTDQHILTVIPMAGGRKATVSTPRQTSNSQTKVDSRIILTEEEKAWLEDYKAAMAETTDAWYDKWHAHYNAAVKANEKFDEKRAAEIAEVLKATMQHPEEGTVGFEQFNLFRDENGVTCMEGNHAMNVYRNRNDSNYGWKQIGIKFTERFNVVLIGQFRVCAVAYAKTGKTDKSMKEAMRLIDANYDNDGNLVIPAGWYVIQG